MQEHQQKIEIMDQFLALEERVDKLLRVCRNLQDRKTDLEARVSGLEKALEQKGVSTQIYEEERAAIRSRVDVLVGRLNDIMEST